MTSRRVLCPLFVHPFKITLLSRALPRKALEPLDNMRVNRKKIGKPCNGTCAARQTAWTTHRLVTEPKQLALGSAWAALAFAAVASHIKKKVGTAKRATCVATNLTTDTTRKRHSACSMVPQVCVTVKFHMFYSSLRKEKSVNGTGERQARERMACQCWGWTIDEISTVACLVRLQMGSP